jgi:hypothetical protein
MPGWDTTSDSVRPPARLPEHVEEGFESTFPRDARELWGFRRMHDDNPCIVSAVRWASPADPLKMRLCWGLTKIRVRDMLTSLIRCSLHKVP